MPPTEEMIDKAIESLSSIRLISFTAEPNSIRPLNDVTLRWEATEPTGSAARYVVFKLQGVRVQNSGSQTISPVRSASYSLTAEAFTGRVILGSVSVNVDLSGCFVNSIPERQFRTRFRQELNENFPEDEGLEIKINNFPNLKVHVNNNRTQLTVDTGGLKLSAEFDVDISTFPDGTLKIDALIGLGAENGRPVHRILNFNSNFNFPKYVDILSGGLGWLVDYLIGKIGNGIIRDKVDEVIGNMLSELYNLIPPGTCALLTVAPAFRRVDFTLCPIRDGVVCRLPMLQLATSSSVVTINRDQLTEDIN